MLLDSQPKRYVIGMDPPAFSMPHQSPRRPPSKARSPTPSPAVPELPASTVLLGVGLLAAVTVMGVIGYYLFLAREEAWQECQRANSASATILTLNARLTNMSAERDQLFRDRRSLLRSIQDEQDKKAAADQLANQWAAAHQQAVNESYQVANKWADHSSQLERSLGSARNLLYETSDSLKTEREVAARTSTELNDKIQALDREAVGYQNLANRLGGEASSLRSTVGSLESSNRSLESQNSSLRSEVSCLSGKVSSLESEVSSLRCQLSHVRCQHCGR